MLASILFAALPLLTGVLAADSSCTRSAVVQKGDFCDTISRKYGVSTYQLAAVNDATISANCDNLPIDGTVCLGITGHDCTKVYTVVADDTCDWIQQMYGISNETLWSNNPQIDATCSNIYIGEVLCVDTASYTYPSVDTGLYEQLAYTYLPYCDE